MTTTQKMLGVMTLLFLVALPLANAQSWNEREKLADIIEQLSELQALIDEASVHADPDARLRFRYDWLRRDLKRVRQGIEDHLDAPESDARQLPPLRGDYRQ